MRRKTHRGFFCSAGPPSARLWRDYAHSTPNVQRSTTKQLIVVRTPSLRSLSLIVADKTQADRRLAVVSSEMAVPCYQLSTRAPALFTVCVVA